MKTLPYTTPTGHTYEKPYDWTALKRIMNDYLQAIIESWDEAERPPNPLADPMVAAIAWNAAVRAEDEIERLTLPGTNLVTTLRL